MALLSAAGCGARGAAGAATGACAVEAATAAGSAGAARSLAARKRVLAPPPAQSGDAGRPPPPRPPGHPPTSHLAPKKKKLPKSIKKIAPRQIAWISLAPPAARAPRKHPNRTKIKWPRVWGSALRTKRCGRRGRRAAAKLIPI